MYGAYAAKCVNIARCVRTCVRAYDWLAVPAAGKERKREGEKEIENTTDEASAELKIEE